MYATGVGLPQKLPVPGEHSQLVCPESFRVGGRCGCCLSRVWAVMGKT